MTQRTHLYNTSLKKTQGEKIKKVNKTMLASILTYDFKSWQLVLITGVSLIFSIGFAILSFFLPNESFNDISFWFHSTIVETYGTILAIIIMLITFKVQPYQSKMITTHPAPYYFSQFDLQMKKIQETIKKPLIFIVLIFLISLIALPFSNLLDEYYYVGFFVIASEVCLILISLRQMAKASINLIENV
ncbi:MAG: hypothetical protein PHS34_08435 [Candidatus Omnitrophica bacterium]|nr:hypothetical protein [Candidatus Nanoarchaeia archaeon]MDD5551272.1 hypothetical protein [Candidatus Omnitrophota bacterium]